MGGVVLSPYVIMWAEVRPNSGRIVRKRDARVMGLTMGWGYKKKDYPTVDTLVKQFMHEVSAYRISALSCVSKRTVLPKKK